MATQMSAMPTNKLAVGTTVASAFAVHISPVVAEIWPQIAPAFLAGPAVTALVETAAAVLAGIIVGWFVPDRPNIP